jgi:hypothetical protein
VPRFLGWIRRHSYAVIEDFKDTNTQNFVAVPAKSPLAAGNAPRSS